MTRLLALALCLTGCGTARQPTLEQRVTAICDRSHAVIAASRYRAVDWFNPESASPIFAFEYHMPVGVH